MKRIILHIGRHKTGTTAIQRFLRTNPDLLESHGYYYPNFGIRGFGHHELGAPLTRGNLRKAGEQANDIISDLRHSIKAELDSQSGTAIVSSEAFQMCDPKVVRKVFPDCDVSVVIYLREQIGYLISAYAQKVHASNYTGSLEDFYTSTFAKTYTQFVDEWNNEFTNDLTLRIYERDDLIEQNVVVDFCEAVLQIDRNVVKELYQGNDANPSLTRNLLEFKLFVNNHEPLPEAHAKLLYNGLSALALSDKSGKIQISDELVKDMHKRFDQSNSDIAKKFFHRDTLFKPFRQPRLDHTASETLVSLATIRNDLIKISSELNESLPIPSVLTELHYPQAN